MALVQKLKALQTERGLTNSEMADLLGVSTSTWAQTKRGEIPLGESIRKGALKLRAEHPDIREAVMASLEE